VSRHAQHGYTLNELLTALAVMAVMLLVSLPAFAAHRRRLAATAATDAIRSVFRSVRARAIAHSRHSGVKFVQDGGQWTYSLYDDGDGDGVMNDDIKSGTDRRVAGPFPLDTHMAPAAIALPAARIKDPDGEWFPPNASPVQFNRSTLCSFSDLGSGTPGSIYLTDGSRDVYAVRVLGTGRVRILRYDSVRGKWGQP
jgi:prepilin-type N-terminal cleavage/methylation domain-containing protein